MNRYTRYNTYGSYLYVYTVKASFSTWTWWRAPKSRNWFPMIGENVCGSAQRERDEGLIGLDPESKKNSALFYLSALRLEHHRMRESPQFYLLSKNRLLKTGKKDFFFLFLFPPEAILSSDESISLPPSGQCNASTRDMQS